MNLPLFLTAYDPTDLPGGSIDPLGFGTGYTALAEALFPGLTGAATEPAYFPVLCAGIRWADEISASGLTPRDRRRARADVAMRLERAWGLALTLQEVLDESAEDGIDLQLVEFGLRGITYFRRERERIERRKLTKANIQFPLLARQQTYGMLGIYTNVAARLGLVDEDDYALTPALGLPLAEAFITATLPGGTLTEIRQLIKTEKANVGVDTLRRWGQQCQSVGRVPEPGVASFRDGLMSVPARVASLKVLQALQLPDEWTELDAMRMGLALVQSSQPLSVSDAERTRLVRLLEASVSLEEAYQWLMVAFERVLWFARQKADHVAQQVVSNDQVIAGCHDRVQSAAERVLAAQDDLGNHGLHEEAQKMDNAVRFCCSAQRTASPSGMVEVIMQRHADVQHGKFDRGRRKLPWLEVRGNTIAVTSSVAGGQRREVTKPEHIPVHAWRVTSALNYLRAAGGVA